VGKRSSDVAILALMIVLAIALPGCSDATITPEVQLPAADSTEATRLMADIESAMSVQPTVDESGTIGSGWNADGDSATFVLFSNRSGLRQNLWVAFPYEVTSRTRIVMEGEQLPATVESLDEISGMTATVTAATGDAPQAALSIVAIDEVGPETPSSLPSSKLADSALQVNDEGDVEATGLLAGSTSVDDDNYAEIWLRGSGSNSLVVLGTLYPAESAGAVEAQFGRVVTARIRPSSGQMVLVSLK